MSKDPMFPVEVSPELAARLKKNESGQRSRMKAKNLKLIKQNIGNELKAAIDLIKIEIVDMVKVGHDQDWTCACHQVPGWHGCFERVDVTKTGSDDDAPVIAHILSTRRGGHHLYGNVSLMRHKCNAEVNHYLEKQDVAKTNSLRKKTFGVDLNGKAVKEKKKKKINSRGFGDQKRSFGKSRGFQKRG